MLCPPPATEFNFLVTNDTFCEREHSFKGSTLELLGIHASDAEWAIVGGTGQLSFARGTIKYRLIKILPEENYKELTIHALYIPPAVSEQL